MKVVAGLGNPGEKYTNNRHNAGFLVLDALASKLGIEIWESKLESLIGRLSEILLVKPQTFMNSSGVAVAKIVNFYKVDLDDLIVIHDDLDIRLGEYKIVKGVGPKVHNGVNSIEMALGAKDFWRVRVGVDNRRLKIEGERFKEEGGDYVLADFSQEEGEKLKTVIDKVVGELLNKLLVV